jgi:hypothetical protein
MRIVAEVAAAVVAVVLVWSGVAKARHPRRAAQAFVDLGVWRRPKVSFAIILSIAEIGGGIGLLISGPASLVASVLAGALFAAFSLLTGRQVFAGRQVACFCFGREDEEVTWLSFARALSLAVLTLFVFGFTTTHELWPSVHAMVAAATAGLGVVGVVAVGGAVQRIIKTGLGVNEILTPDSEVASFTGAAAS